MRLMKLLKPATLLGAGAALGYLFDPDRGRSRRARVRDQGLSKARHVAREANRRSRYAEGRLEGASARAGGAGRYSPESDVDLREHIRQVLAEMEVETTDVTVDVVDGVATLRGQVRTPDQIRAVQAKVASVPGVRRTESYLHLPQTPAPNKAEAIDAS